MEHLDGAGWHQVSAYGNSFTLAACYRPQVQLCRANLAVVEI
jgi:hypothetical protein